MHSMVSSTPSLTKRGASQILYQSRSFSPIAIASRLGSEGMRWLEMMCSAYPHVDPRCVLLQLSLHLPRFPGEHAFRNFDIKNEAERLARRLHSLRYPHGQDIPKSPRICRLNDLRIMTIDDDVARAIHECFHYLLSHRASSIHIGLRSPCAEGWPLAMVSLSPFDLWNVEQAIDIEHFGARTLVLSRVFAFEGSPRNAISYLLGQTRKWLRLHMPQISFLITYVNPNVGFTGSSYRADNWSLIGVETEVRYRYIGGDYKTERFLHKHGRLCRVGRGEDTEVMESQHPLNPLNVFVRSVSGEPLPSATLTFARWNFIDATATVKPLALQPHN